MESAELQHDSGTESDNYEYPDKVLIKSVTVPETVKRRQPSKHYVYKVVVEWTNGKKIIIYRKYSLFFDFVFKLNELVSKLSPLDFKKELQLPELPGRVLFGRSEVHQVAEKRRKKIEEFCQKLIELPPEISQSFLVRGFFNTWPDDTLLRKPSVKNMHVISSPILPPPRSTSPSPPPSLSLSSSELTYMSHNDAPSHSPSPPPQLESALEAIISHPDEMESLEQYRVLANYERKDSHQVNLVVNQLVHVIEKHDTGWWMVMSEDEQGYAPASYLEPVEECNSDRDVHPEDSTGQVYEAMESYFAENDDEITIKVGDKIEVLSKSMDGWWKIRCNGRVGFSPAALIRRRQTLDSSVIFESEKSIYEGLNIHRPPPRRNTINRSVIAKVSKIPTQYSVPHSISPLHEASNDPTRGENDEDAPKHHQTTSSSNIVKSIFKKKLGESHTPLSHSTSVDSVDGNEHIYEMEPEPICDQSDLDNAMVDKGSIYENTNFPTMERRPVMKKNSSPSVLQDIQTNSNRVASTRTKSVPSILNSKMKGSYHTPDDYEDPDAIIQDMESQMDDYIVMSDQLHNTYVDPEDLRRGSSGSNVTVSSDSFTSSTKRLNSTSSSLSPKFNGVQSAGGMIPVFDDDYIEMNPVYEEPPLEEDEECDSADILKTEKNKTEKTLSKSKSSVTTKRPTPPPPYRGNSPLMEKKKKSLTKAKSMEDIIAFFSSPKTDNPQKFSPELKHRKITTNSSPHTPAHLGQHETSPNFDVTNGPTVSRNRSETAPEQPSITSSPPYHSRLSHPLERSTSPPSAIVGTHGKEKQNVSPHHPLQTATSSSDSEPMLPKTYVAMCSYTSQSEGCLSFSAGDKCVLIQQNIEGWWLVNIGGREGWTPGEYWKESLKKKTSLPKPPNFAPKRLQDQKPLNQRENSFTSSLDSALDSSLNVREFEGGIVDTKLFGAGKHLQVEELKSKSHGPPKPLPPLHQGKAEKPVKPPKPALPNRPEKLKNSQRASVSPPNKNPALSPSPPLLPPPNVKKEMNPHISEVNSHTPDQDATSDHYTALSELSTQHTETPSWFFGKMGRGEAEKFLMDHGRQKEFLVRERTSKDGYYALSIRYHYSCRHFNIDPTPDGQFTMGNLNFGTLEQIVRHYQLNSLFFQDGKHETLGQPAKKRQRPSNSSRHTPNTPPKH